MSWRIWLVTDANFDVRAADTLSITTLRQTELRRFHVIVKSTKLWFGKSAKTWASRSQTRYRRTIGELLGKLCRFSPAHQHSLAKVDASLCRDQNYPRR